MKTLRILKLALLLLLIVSLAAVAWRYLQYQAAAEAYEAALAVKLPEGLLPKITPAPELPEEAAALAEIDLEALRETNPDVIGWIEIPGTVVSYPLMQGTDNNYYLHHTWNNENNAVGAIFLECENSPALDGFHTIVYGHRMRNGSMFGSLKDYKEPDYWQEHPNVYILTDDGIYWYSIFAAYEAAVKGIVYQLDLSGKEDELIQYALDNSVIDTGVTPDADDRILTLSTCTGTGYSNRWVVQAVCVVHP